MNYLTEFDVNIDIVLVVYIFRGSLNKFPDFFRMGTLLIVHT